MLDSLNLFIQLLWVRDTRDNTDLRLDFYFKGNFSTMYVVTQIISKMYCNSPGRRKEQSGTGKAVRRSANIDCFGCNNNVCHNWELVMVLRT